MRGSVLFLKFCALPRSITIAHNLKSLCALIATTCHHLIGSRTWPWVSLWYRRFLRAKSLAKLLTIAHGLQIPSVRLVVFSKYKFIELLNRQFHLNAYILIGTSKYRLHFRISLLSDHYVSLLTTRRSPFSKMLRK